MSGPVRKIQDAIELLSVVEHLAEALAKQENENSVPWRGINLTIRNAKELLASAHTVLHRDFDRKKSTPEPGVVRELPPAPPAPVGLFNRVVLPKEETPPPSNDPLEH